MTLILTLTFAGQVREASKPIRYTTQNNRVLTIGCLLKVIQSQTQIVGIFRLHLNGRRASRRTR